MSLSQWIVVLVAAQRLAELVHGERNARRLLAEGGREVGARHYPLFAILHGGWLAALFFLVPRDAPIHAAPLAVYVLLLGVRMWATASLGRFWTTRVITLPGAPLVATGPYRLMRHPNYLVVAAEVAVLPMAFGAFEIALAFTVPNLLLLRHRIRIEDAALAARRG